MITAPLLTVAHSQQCSKEALKSLSLVSKEGVLYAGLCQPGNSCGMPLFDGSFHPPSLSDLVKKSEGQSRWLYCLLARLSPTKWLHGMQGALTALLEALQLTLDGAGGVQSRQSHASGDGSSSSNSSTPGSACSCPTQQEQHCQQKQQPHLRYGQDAEQQLQQEGDIVYPSLQDGPPEYSSSPPCTNQGSDIKVAAAAHVEGRTVRSVHSFVESRVTIENRSGKSSGSSMGAVFDSGADSYVEQSTWLQAAAVACQALAKICRASVVSLQVVLKNHVSQGAYQAAQLGKFSQFRHALYHPVDCSVGMHINRLYCRCFSRAKHPVSHCVHVKHFLRPLGIALGSFGLIRFRTW